MSDEKARKRFIHEAQAASSLEHSNICGIYEIDETPEGQMFIVMPCYEGESLAAKIERDPLKLDDAVDVAMQVASGLSKAHEKGIIHRDIKPGGHSHYERWPCEDRRLWARQAQRTHEADENRDDSGDCGVYVTRTAQR